MAEPNAAARESSSTATSREVLIVEPSSTLRRVCAERCEDFGAQAVFCEGALEALEMVSKSRPMAIIASLELDDLPGCSLVAALKASCFYSPIPIVILTSREEVTAHFRGQQPDLVLRKLGNLRGKLDEFFESLGLRVADEEAPQADAPLQNMRILVAEDSRVQQRFLAQVLHVAGAEVELAANGLEAVEMVQGQEYDLILMDVEMPHLDGFQAAERMREAGVRTPMVACTALPNIDQLQDKAEDAGFFEMVGKPINRVELIELCLEHKPA